MLDELLARRQAKGTDVEAPRDGVVNMIEAAELSRWPTIDIVKLVLEGGLARIELLHWSVRFKSVLVDPFKVRSVLVARQAADRLGLDEAARRIGVPTWGVSQLLKRTSAKSLSQKLTAKGLAPLLPKRMLNCPIYHRSDVEQDPFESPQ